MKVTILGCGHSGGTPMIGGIGWGNCDPANPKNRRTRPSILVETNTAHILVDTSPDLREQFLAADIRRVDTVLFTHAHADHLHGIDDLRAINRVMKAPIEAYADAKTWDEIRERFEYTLTPLREGSKFFYKPVLVPHEIVPGETVQIGGMPVTAFEQDHGVAGTSLGYRIGDLGYTTDVVDMPEDGFGILAGIDTWLIGALMDDPHPTHAHVAKVLSWVERVGPRQAVLTHMSNLLDYDALAAQLPDGVAPAYDGLVLDIPS